jgi:hypothetical protein
LPPAALILNFLVARDFPGSFAGRDLEGLLIGSKEAAARANEIKRIPEIPGRNLKLISFSGQPKFQEIRTLNKYF